MPHVDELVHDQHDPILVVSLASGDLAATDRDYATAQSLISSCSDCARLHDDVRAIARATKALPPAQRTRDFRLTDADAAQLRPAGWRRLLGGLANGPLLSRQLGAGLATLGIAGLLLTALPGIPLGGMASSAGASPATASAPAAAEQAPSSERLQSDHAFAAGQVAASAAPSAGIDTAGGNPPAPEATFRDTTVSGVSRNPANASPAPLADGPTLAANAFDGGETPDAAPEQSSSGGPSMLAVVSIVLVAAGLVLLVARRIARGSTSS